MNNLATGQNSSICQEESCTFPVADNYFNLQDIYSLCQEEAGNMTLCACGCKQEIIPKRHHKWKPPKYINGHWKRGKKVGDTWMKGRHHTEESKLKISNAHKGKVVWNKGLKGIHLSPETEFKKGQTSPNKDKQLSEITKIKISQSRMGKYVGDENPNWRGGIAYLPYCPKFNKELKERIRDRDNRTCQLCGTKENGKKLAVHHIHYDKPNCEPDLISLCGKCNPKVNFNRDYYEDLFIDKLVKRGLIIKCIFPAWWEQ